MTNSKILQDQLDKQKDLEAIRGHKERINADALARGEAAPYDVSQIVADRDAQERERKRLEQELAQIEVAEGKRFDPMDAYRAVTLPHHVQMALEAPERLANLPLQVQETLKAHPELAEEVMNHINLEAQYGESAARLLVAHPELQTVVAPEMAAATAVVEPAAVALAL